MVQNYLQNTALQQAIGRHGSWGFGQSCPQPWGFHYPYRLAILIRFRVIVRLPEKAEVPQCAFFGIA
jgi:hypothetical protein